MGETLDIDIDQYKVYKTDWLREPTNILKNEEQQLSKAQVRAGDLLLIKPKDFVVASEQITVRLYTTVTGVPGEDTPAQEIVVPFDLHLGEFRTRVFSLDLFSPAPKSAECVRLRERTKTGHYGKIYREDGKTLKALKISYSAEIVCQALPDSEPFTTGLSLFLCVRDPATRTTSKPCECVFEGSQFPNIDDLYSFALVATGQQWDIRDLVVAKFVPHQFVWEVVEDSRPREERGTLLGTPPDKGQQGIYNLKKSPVNLKEGDMFAVKHSLADPDNEDDFQCEGDRVRRDAFVEGKKVKGNKPAKRKEAGVHILA